MEYGREGESDSAENISVVRRLVRDAIRARRQAIVYALARRFSGTVEMLGDISPTVERDVATGWTRIESLSQLRAVVGGRFQNLKQKWVSAGFPLREHRGDREEKATVSQSGWIELSVWIGKQGYETKIASDEDPWLFEVRKL
jgi:hypothetical protein